MAEKRTDNESQTTVVCIDSYEGGVLHGRLYNPFLEGGEAFGSLIQFLRRMEELLDDKRFPQSFTAKRELVPTESSRVCRQADGIRRGTLATFAVKVLFRQNSSWQGCITWLEKDREEHFRSALELVFMMDGALSA
jgi:hypothetical protein